MISFSELLLIGLVMLLVMGPKETQRTCQWAGRVWARLNRLSDNVRKEAARLWNP